MRPKYSGFGRWKPNCPGARCEPKMVPWPKVEGAAGRNAASGDEVSIVLQDIAACSGVVVGEVVHGVSMLGTSRKLEVRSQVACWVLHPASECSQCPRCPVVGERAASF